MKDKNIKERYNNAINAFMNSIVEREEHTILKIEKIEQIENEYNEYKKKSIKHKIDLGSMILSGTALTILATKLLLKDTNSLELEVTKDLISILIGTLGVSMIPISIDNYRKDRLNINIDANKSLKEYEEIIEKEKVNVKTR